MRPIRIQVASQAPSAWVPVDHRQVPCEIGFHCGVSEGGSATYKVQHGFSDLIAIQASVSRSTTTATVDFGATVHGLAVGDSVIVAGAGAPFDGTFAVASAPTSTSITYTVANSGATASGTGKFVLIYVGDHVNITGKTSSQDDNYAFPINYIRLNVTTYSSGQVTMVVNQGVN